MKRPDFHPGAMWQTVFCQPAETVAAKQTAGVNFFNDKS
jgi:hypothetical protein